MPELPRVSGKAAIKVFESLDWESRSIEGSHHVYNKVGCRSILSIPVHGNKELKRGLLRGLIRTAGMTVEEFVDALEQF